MSTADQSAPSESVLPLSPVRGDSTVAQDLKVAVGVATAPRPAAEVLPEGQVMVEATQVRGLDTSFGWAILVHDTLVEYVVRDGVTVHYSVTRQGFFETEFPGFMTMVRTSGLVEIMGVDVNSVRTLNVSFPVPRSVYEKISEVDRFASQGGVSALHAYLGRAVRDIAL